MLVVIGLLIIIFSVFGGFAAGGGHLYALFQPTEFVIIGGAALGSFIISNNMKVIKASFKGALSTLRAYPYSNKYNVELLSLFFELSNKIRKDGPLSIESDVENYTESPLFNKYPLIIKDKKVMEFLTDNLRLIITGRVDVTHLELVMDIDIETYENEFELPITAINKVADSMPAFGIVAAVMGVVHTMESIGVPPEELGALVAKALVGTFLGVLIGYGFIGPFASSLDHRRLGAIKILHSIKVALLASAHNFAPTIGVEMARKVLYSDARPNSKELEDILKEIKANKTSGTSNV
jgi:chemotaxis protein MotA